MYGGSGKLGRGRGGGVPVKRSIHSTFQPSSVQRPSITPAGGRLSAAGGNRNRNKTSGTASAAATVSTADESFSLVRNSPPNFGMIIRLTPNLIDEIKRVEAQGGSAKIKFDSCANLPDGNVGLFCLIIGYILILTVLYVIECSFWCVINPRLAKIGCLIGY